MTGRSKLELAGTVFFYSSLFSIVLWINSGICTIVYDEGTQPRVKTWLDFPTFVE